MSPCFRLSLNGLAKPLIRAGGIFAGAFMIGGLLVGADPSRASTDQAEIEAACKAQLTLKPGGCACIAERAETELDDQQRRWLILRVTGDEPAAQEAQMDMTQRQLIGVATFMANAPVECDR